MSENKITTYHPLLDFLSKLSNYLVGVTIICYGAGFAITNLYLGSMGIVTFEILRARYIIAGLLFAFFLGAIVYLVTGLMQTLRKNHDKPRITTIMKVLWFSFLNIGILYFVIPAVGIFAGSTGSQVYDAPKTVQPLIPWADWFAQEPLAILRSTSILFGIIIFVVLLVVTVFIIINPKDKDGTRKTRRQILSEAYKKIKETKGKDFASLIGAFILFYLFNLSGSLVSFYLAGTVSTTSKVGFTLPNGWAQLFNAIVIIYAFIGIYLTFIALYPPVTTDDDTALSTPSSFIYLISFCIILIVPLYAFRVYPALPQQIGGGQLQKVQVVISNKSIESQFSDPNIETYLIDKTTNTSFFMLQNITNKEYRIVEMQNGLIQSIIYAHSP